MNAYQSHVKTLRGKKRIGRKMRSPTVRSRVRTTQIPAIHHQIQSTQRKPKKSTTGKRKIMPTDRRNSVTLAGIVGLPTGEATLSKGFLQARLNPPSQPKSRNVEVISFLGRWPWGFCDFPGDSSAVRFVAPRECEAYPLTLSTAMKWLFAIALLLSGTFPAQAQQGKGSIRGIVVNEEGSPVAGASVFSGFADNRPLGGRLPSARTNETGHFVIDGLQFDDYHVAAFDEDDDYPYLAGTWLLFDIDKKPVTPRVRLSAQAPTATVEIRLGPKAGVLIGKISDAISGAPPNACAGFKDISAPDFRTAYPVTTHYRLLVPADADITLKVWVGGL
jgi:hypothetical protein